LTGKGVTTDETQIKYSSLLLDKFQRKNKFDQAVYLEEDKNNIRDSLYRPFSRQYLYFDKNLIDAPTLQPYFFPTAEIQQENKIIAITVHSQSPFIVQALSHIPCMDIGGRPTQCFPFYTYSKDGTNRKENISDWSLEQFQTHYQDPKITKWDIFHYTYALLHYPHYRQRYAANLKRELPRIPFAPEFHPFAIAGKRLTEIHINYEQQPEYRLKHIENKDLPIDWRVEKMRLSKDTNDPNRLDDEEYIVRLIKQVITVSLETVKIVKGLPDLGLPND